MTIQLETALRNAMADEITAALGSNAIIRIYDGTPPANLAAALSGNNLLVELPCSSTFAPAASGGVLTANAIVTTNASASGTPTFFRALTSGGVAKAQGTVGESGSGADAIITLSVPGAGIVSGAPVACSITLTMPGA